MKIMLLPTGTTAVFKNGQQVPKLQESWFMLYIQFLVAAGVDPVDIEFVMPNGEKAEIFMPENEGFSWRTFA